MLSIEIAAVLALTLVNGLLAMSELAVVSSRKSRLEQLAAQGSRGARAALKLAEDPSRFLSTVQIGITLVGVVAGAFSGATLGQRLGAWLDTFAWLSPHGASVGTAITVIAITYLSLVVGELVPKRLALANPERVAALIARPMGALSTIAAPAVFFLQASTEGLIKLLGLSTTRESTVTEDEVKSLIAEGTEAGVFMPQEREMIEGVLRLADRPVRLIMTPRAQIVWVDVSSDRASVLSVAKSHRFSRLLVCEGSVDRPIGFLHTKELICDEGACEQIDLRQLVAPLVFVPDRSTVLNLLNRFKKEKAHLAAVVDEYGAMEGVVSLTDVIEAIAGDIPEAGEAPGPQLTRREDGSWLADGTLPTDELAAATGLNLGDEVEMLAAFVLNRLGRIPSAGAFFVHDGARFEVVDMDGNRVDKILIHCENSAKTECDSPG